MSTVNPDQIDVFLLDDVIWIAAGDTGLSLYDFPFRTFFPCRHPWRESGQITAVGRFGAVTNYPQLYAGLLASDIQLIHSPQQYQLASELCYWYPYLSELTPLSYWFDTPPAVAEVAEKLAWPVFVKGSRRTSRHQAALSIVHSPSEYESVVERYRQNPNLRGQPFVCREFIKLRPVPSSPSELIPASFEFRTFWWYGECVGFGPYWAAIANYSWTDQEEQSAIRIAQAAAHRLQLPFLVIDVAQTIQGDWIVIECNDGQESSYAGVAPVALWQNIMSIERRRGAAT